MKRSTKVALSISLKWYTCKSHILLTSASRIEVQSSVSFSLISVAVLKLLSHLSPGLARFNLGYFDVILFVFSVVKR